MDAFAIPLVVFTAFMASLLVAVIRGSIRDPIGRRAGVTWAVTCPVAGLLYGIGVAPLGVVSALVSTLALGSLAYWFAMTEPDDSDDSDEETEEPVEPDPGPSDDLVLELPRKAEPELDIDWGAFDRVRADWEKELAPAESEREQLPTGV
jgi:hypothetical protein